MRNFLTGIHIALTLFGLLIGNAAIAQRTITAKVVDAATRKGIEGATVRLMPTTLKATTNSLGFFQMSINNLDTLLIQASGYTSITFKIPLQNSFQVSLSLRSAGETAPANRARKRKKDLVPDSLAKKP